MVNQTRDEEEVAGATSKSGEPNERRRQVLKAPAADGGSEEYVVYFTRRMSGVIVKETKAAESSYKQPVLDDNWLQSKKQQSHKSRDEKYMVFFTRKKLGSEPDEAVSDLVDYEIVMNDEGGFAARRLDTGYVIAGYDHEQPDLSIEEAARIVEKQAEVYRVYVRGDFSTVMCRIINEYYDRLRQKYGIWSRQISVKRFPVGRIRPEKMPQDVSK